MTWTMPWVSLPKAWIGMPKSAQFVSSCLIWAAACMSTMGRPRGVVGVPWSAVATVLSGRRTCAPRMRSPVKAWGLVTSWTRWRSIARTAGAPGSSETTCSSQIFSTRVRGWVMAAAALLQVDGGAQGYQRPAPGDRRRGCERLRAACVPHQPLRRAPAVQDYPTSAARATATCRRGQRVRHRDARGRRHGAGARTPSRPHASHASAAPTRSSESPGSSPRCGQPSQLGSEPLLGRPPDDLLQPPQLRLFLGRDREAGRCVAQAPRSSPATAEHGDLGEALPAGMGEGEDELEHRRLVRSRIAGPVLG